MALKNCNECNKEVSSKAKTCPNCGAPIKQKTSLFTWLVTIIIIFIVVVQIVPLSNDTSAVQAPLTREEGIRNQFSQWDGSHIKLARRVKATMHDPDSFEHVRTTYRDNGTLLYVTMEFRGKNAFGGKVLQTVNASIVASTGNVLLVN